VENVPIQDDQSNVYDLQAMTDDKPTILLPEPDDPRIADFRDHYSQQYPDINFVFDKVDLAESAHMVKDRRVDAVVVGASYPSKDVFLTAIHEIGAVDKFASSYFIMEKEGKPRIYLADCAVNVNPKAEQLVKIAEQTCENVRLLGDEPIVAFISYSTSGSGGDNEAIQKVSQAAEEFRTKHPDIVAYGEIQWDAARKEEIYKIKNKGEGYKDGKAPNVFIFPNLDTGNTVYKVLQDDADYTAIGPLIQGLEGNVDFHDLSRGVTPADLGEICLKVAQHVRALSKETGNQDLSLAA
jgi:phosphate acetyltransferase